MSEGNTYTNIPCHGGHLWTHLGEIPEGLPCNCGKETWKPIGKLISEKEARIKELEETISKLQIENSRGYYTPIHEADRKRLMAENQTLKADLAEAVELISKIKPEIEEGGHADDYEGIAVRCPNCSLCEVENFLSRHSEKGGKA